jgi:hypothetical protein
MRALLPKFSAFAILLLSMSCTKADDQPAVTTPNVGSYRFKGRLVSCQASATTSSSYSVHPVSSDSLNYLVSDDSTKIVSINLHATSEGKANPPALLLDYERPGGQPSAAYHLAIVTYLPGSDTEPVASLDHIAGTLRETTTGLFEGTFSNTKPGSSPLSEGSFSNVHVVRRY